MPKPLSRYEGEQVCKRRGGAKAPTGKHKMVSARTSVRPSAHALAILLAAKSGAAAGGQEASCNPTASRPLRGRARICLQAAKPTKANSQARERARTRTCSRKPTKARERAKRRGAAKPRPGLDNFTNVFAQASQSPSADGRTQLPAENHDRPCNPRQVPIIKRLEFIPSTRRFSTHGNAQALPPPRRRHRP